MIEIALALVLSQSQTQDEPKCYEYRIGNRVREICDDWFDERRAEFMRQKPVPKMPIQPSKEGDFVPEHGDGRVEIPSCYLAEKDFATASNQLMYYLEQQRWSHANNSLTTEAAYNAREAVFDFAIQIPRDAWAKYRYAPRRLRHEGDQACIRHFKTAIDEIHSIGHLIINEMNKGNYDLAGTGLNPYAHEVNK